MFERWYPREIAMWIRAIPQAYTYEAFDHEEWAVLEMTTTWLEYVSHYVASINRSFICSSGPHRDQPCYGDAIRKKHFEWVEQVEEETGVKPNKWPPIGARRMHALAITLLEDIYSVPATDDKKRVKKTRDGNIIYNHIPAPIIEIPDGVSYPQTFGHNAHWSMGTEHLQQLADLDAALQNKDAITGKDLYAWGVACAECEEQLHEFESPMEGEDLIELRGKEFGCSACGSKGLGVPLLACPDEQEFRQGGITSFDLRIKSVPIGDKKSIIKIVDARVPDYDEHTTNLINNPLDLESIFAPSDIDYQRRTLGKMAKDVNPIDGVLATSYGKEGTSETSETIDYQS
jgi:hypothetical protein